MVKILIVDDETSAGNILKILIEKHIGAATEIRYCVTVKGALEILQTFKPTLVMLDIEMPKFNGFDFFEHGYRK